MSETDKIVYASERAETDETACEDLAAWEQEETGQEKNKSNNCVNAAFKFFVIYKLQEERFERGLYALLHYVAGKTPLWSESEVSGCEEGGA